MKTLKTIPAFIVGLFAFTTLNANSPEKTAAKMVERIGNDVTITQEQKEAIHEKALSYLQEVQQVDFNLDEEEIIRIKENLSAEYYQAVDTILSEDQKEIFYNKWEERKMNAVNKTSNP